MRTINRSLVSIGLGLTIISLSACSSSDPAPEPEAKELGVKKDEGPSRSELEMMEEGKRLFESGLYTVARDQFDKLRTSYPLSPYSEFAELKIADSYFHTGEYLTAAQSYEEFTKNHPASESSPYALLMAGRSQQLTNRGVGRDTAPLEKAEEFYDRVSKSYASSIYAPTAAQYKFEVDNELKAHDEMVRDYYRKKSNDPAVSVREQDLSTRWSGLRAPQASSNAAGSNALTAAFGPPQPQAVLAAVDSKSASAARTTSGQDLIQRIECRSERQRMVTIYLTADAPQPGRLRSSDAGLQFMMPWGSEREFHIDCFGKGDLSVTKAGEVKLSGVNKGEILSMANPPRYLLIPAS